MKIEPGDLCITRNATAAVLKCNEGRLVIAHKYVGYYNHLLKDAWQCECIGGAMTDKNGRLYTHPVINAKNLRPIRDQPGADESLAWKAVPKQPEKETAWP